MSKAKKTKFYQKEIKIKDLQNPDKYIGKMDTLAVRSSWELIMIKFLDKNKYVLEWCSEGVVIPYISPIDNKKHNYYVDFYAKVIDKQDKMREWLMEVKPYKETIEPVVKSTRKTSTNAESIKRFVINQAKWASARDYCQRNNMKFRLITERDLSV